MPTPENLLASFLFGAVGLAAFVYGKRNGALKPIVIGIALMVYPYFISETWLLCAIGAVLTGSLFIFRD